MLTRKPQKGNGAEGRGKTWGLSTGLHVIAGLFFIYAIWAAKHSMSYVAAMLASGQLTIKGNEYSIVSFYMSNGAQYAFFAIVLFTLGWMVRKGPFGEPGLRTDRVLHRTGSLPNHRENRDGEKACDGGDDEDDFEEWFRQSEEEKV